MKHADKNRDPERARKRAVADARCALRKLDLLAELERLAADAAGPSNVDPDECAAFVLGLLRALGAGGGA